MGTKRTLSLVNSWETIRYELLNTRICDMGLQIVVRSGNPCQADMGPARGVRLGNPPIPFQGFQKLLSRLLVLRAPQADVPQALYAVGLTQHVPHLLVQWQRLLVAAPRLVVLRAPHGEVSQAPDAVGLAQHVAHAAIQGHRLLVAAPRLVMLREFQGDIPQTLNAASLAQQVPHLA